FGEKEALAMTALDLGHGGGRGRYVAQVYGRRDTD
ncbi:TPA: DNA-binding protein, partial [Salmonella enterica subsp. salamae]|nr:DNA-binding protein [Salmonella enterica subsp. salamae serovar 42:f,g,t:--]